VRQLRVAELDDDVAVCFLGATRRRRNVIGSFAISNEKRSEDYAGEDSALCGNSSEISLTRYFGEPARSEMHTFSRVTVAKPATTKKSRELERTSREPDFGSRRIHFFHGNGNKRISTLLNQCAKSLETRSARQRRVTKQERRRGPGVGNEHFSICKNRSPPLKRSKAS